MRVRYSLKLVYLKGRTSPAGRDDSLLIGAKFSQFVAAQAVLPELQAGFDHLTVAFERLNASRGQITISITVPPACRSM